MRVFGLAAVLLVGGPVPSTPPLNQKIVQFAQSKLGEQVGDGECTSLVLAAFRNAGARRFSIEGPEKRIVWGNKLESFDAVVPGDVLQFRDAVFKGEKTYPNGSYRYWQQTFPQHTAIVASVKKTRTGLVFGLLQQNVMQPGPDQTKRKTVQRGTIRMAELRSGSVLAYRPVADEETGANPTAP